MADEKRFLNYENSFSIYRSKTAVIGGVLYFSKGYQSTPVIGLQFAEVNDANAQEKTFNWDTESKVWFFPTYDKCYEFVRKLNKWKQALTKLRTDKVTDQNQITEMFKDYAEKNKISNPIKKKSMYLSVRFYNEYFFQMSLVGQNVKCSVSLYEEELDMLIKYFGDFLSNYHNLTLMHRMITISRGLSKGGGGSTGEDSGNGGGGGYNNNRSNSSNSGNRSGGGGNSGGNRGSWGGNKNAQPNDTFGESAPAQQSSGGGRSSGGSQQDAVDNILSGGSLDDLMKGVSEDIPF